MFMLTAPATEDILHYINNNVCTEQQEDTKTYIHTNGIDGSVTLTMNRNSIQIVKVQPNGSNSTFTCDIENRNILCEELQKVIYICRYYPNLFNAKQATISFIKEEFSPLNCCCPTDFKAAEKIVIHYYYTLALKPLPPHYISIGKLLQRAFYDLA